MKNLKPVKPAVIDGFEFFDPYDNKHNKKFPVCVCGFELIKEDQNIYKCRGGKHRYIMDAGDVIKDKFGKLWFKKPENSENKQNG